MSTTGANVNLSANNTPPHLSVESWEFLANTPGQQPSASTYRHQVTANTAKARGVRLRGANPSENILDTCLELKIPSSAVRFVTTNRIWFLEFSKNTKCYSSANLEDNFNIQARISGRFAANTLLTLSGGKRKDRENFAKEFCKRHPESKVLRHVHENKLIQGSHKYCSVCFAENHDKRDCKSCYYCHFLRSCPVANEPYYSRQKYLKEKYRSKGKLFYHDRDLSSLPQNFELVSKVTNHGRSGKRNMRAEMALNIDGLCFTRKVFVNPHNFIEQSGVRHTIKKFILSMDVEKAVNGNMQVPIQVIVHYRMKRLNTKVIYQTFVKPEAISDMLNVFHGVELQEVLDEKLSTNIHQVKRELNGIFENFYVVVHSGQEDLKCLGLKDLYDGNLVLADQLKFIDFEQMPNGVKFIDLAQVFPAYLDDGTKNFVKLSDMYFVLCGGLIQDYHQGSMGNSAHSIEKDSRATYKVFEEYINRLKAGKWIPNGKEIRYLAAEHRTMKPLRAEYSRKRKGSPPKEDAKSIDDCLIPNIEIIAPIKIRY